MLYAILLLILAVLLFGSSAVIGAIGAILGFIAFAAGLAVLSWYASPFIVSLGVDPGNVVGAIGITIVLLIGVLHIAILILDRRK